MWDLSFVERCVELVLFVKDLKVLSTVPIANANH